ncbi:hypothetical protein DC522_33220 [Microvirga sp. KLBC 81]|nr:hypothetical protein DC522_33220 [Microvirga sp. KLBC 81]
MEGDLSSATDATGAAAIAACAKWRAVKGDPAQVQQLLAEADRLGNTDDAVVAASFLAPINSDVRRMALQIVLNDQGPKQSLQWCATADIGPADSDSVSLASNPGPPAI